MGEPSAWVGLYLERNHGFGAEWKEKPLDTGTVLPELEKRQLWATRPNSQGVLVNELSSFTLGGACVFPSHTVDTLVRPM